MQKILIIGNAGAGKTTFSLALAEQLGIPLVHLDKLYWCGNWEHVSREKFDVLLQAELEKPRWIIDGNFSRTIPHRLQYCDTVFYFDMPTRVCLWGITKRVFQNRGRTRQDMGGDCPEHFDSQKLNLYKNVWGYNRQHRKRLYQLLGQTQAKVIIFKNRRQVRAYLKKGGTLL